MGAAISIHQESCFAGATSLHRRLYIQNNISRLFAGDYLHCMLAANLTATSAAHSPLDHLGLRPSQKKQFFFNFLKELLLRLLLDVGLRATVRTTRK